MATWQRFGVALTWTIGLMIAGLLYNEVFVEGLLPVVPTEGTFGTPVGWMEVLVPLIIAGLLLTVWGWVIAGAVQEERTVQQQRVRR